MSIIQFKKANCKNCYKCIRQCDLKAIKFSDDQAYILEDQCILCGKCTLICPQNAKQIKSDIPLVKSFLKSGARLFVSLAPSYVGAFPGATFTQMSTVLKKLGFSRVEETAIGATQVSKKYGELLKEKKMKNIITTGCPSTVMLVERYYPELVKYLAPVVSPAIAHGKMLKEIYGKRNKVIFIGPCISKKYEASTSNNLNAVLTFDELKRWMDEDEIIIGEEDLEAAEMHATSSRLYPLPGEIIKAVPTKLRSNYKSISVDGIDRCIQILNSLRDHNIEGYFIEMNTCAGSCIEGPGMHNLKVPFLIFKDLLFENSNKKTVTPIPMTENLALDLSIDYNYKKTRHNAPSEETIKNILASIGKFSEEHMLNCGTCGYSTCREKAIAVYQGKADLKMCLPYMREKAESMSNIILENTPNAIFMADKNFNILEYNKAATNLFKLIDKNVVGLPIELLLNSEEFNNIKISGEEPYDFSCKSIDEQVIVNLNIIATPKGDYIIIAKDVTKEEEKNQEIERIRKETIETAQRVIAKQIRAAQEIASLLGETTGETKAVLTKLIKI